VEQSGRSFLPIIDRPLDNTAMTAYMTCPREYYYGMILHRRSKGKSPALVFGSAWHKAMEVHYKSGGDRDLVRYAVQQSWEGHDSADDYRTLPRVLLDYDRYVKQYGEDPSKEEGKTLGTVGEWMVELATNAQGDDLLHPWAGKLDRIVQIQGLNYVEDHKTTSRLDKHYFRQFELSNQMMGYNYLGNTLLPSAKIVGVRINLSHVLTEKTAFVRKLITFTPSQIKDWTANINRWMTRLAGDYETAKLATYEDIVRGKSGAFPLHFGDNGCSRKFGICGYHPVCSASPQLRQHTLESEFIIKPWNPLEEDDEV
jgi:hypothetical protein